MKKFLILSIITISLLLAINLISDLIVKDNIPLVIAEAAVCKTHDRQIITVGKIKESDTTELTVNFPVFYDEICVKTGDSVKAGDILAKINEKETVKYLKKLDNENLKNILSNFGLAQSVISIFNSESEMLSDYSAVINDIESYCSDIIAPCDGIIVSSNIEGKSLMTSPSELVIADRSEMTYEADINEDKVGEIALGQKVNITCNAVKDKMFIGKVTSISPNSNGGKVKIKATIDNADNLLKYGYEAEGCIITKTYENTVSVPYESIIKRGNQSYIFVNKNNRAYLKEIKVLTESLDGCAVSGINYGESVILNGDSLVNGQSIKIAE